MNKRQFLNLMEDTTMDDDTQIGINIRIWNNEQSTYEYLRAQVIDIVEFSDCFEILGSPDY